MKKALMLTPTGEELKDASDLTKDDQHREFRCPVCKAKAILCVTSEDSGRSNYFRSDWHKKGCGVPKGGKT